MAEAESIPTEISNLRVGNYTEPLAVDTAMTVTRPSCFLFLDVYKRQVVYTVKIRENENVVWEDEFREI